MKEELGMFKRDKKKALEALYLVEMEEFIIETYNANYERLRLEGGHALSPEVKRQGLLQVIMYFKKLREVAETVTETEVKLTLPEQLSPKGNKFTIEGVVDIIRDNETDHTTMYDIKTHDADFVKGNITDYEDQLNVYTHIWQKLRGEKLDKTAVIATQFPRALKKAINEDDDVKMAREMETWQPIIEIPFSQDNVQNTIENFACVVDKIETRDFTPPTQQKLKDRIPGTRQKFVTRVCRNCDARFSCDAYREYNFSNPSFKGGFSEFISDLGPAEEVENYTNTNSMEAPAPDNIEDLI